MNKKQLLVVIFSVIGYLSFAQMASVLTVDPQKSSFKTLGTGLNLDMYRADNIRYPQFHEMIETSDGYFKVGLNSNSGYQKKTNLSIHVIKLDKGLQIVDEFNIELDVKDNKSELRPFALYRNGNKIELIGNNVNGDELNIINWEFNANDFSVLKEDNKLASFAISGKNYYDFLYDINEATNYFGICFIEQKGKKSKACSMFSFSCNNNMQPVFQKTVDLPFDYNDDILSRFKVAANGDAWALLDDRVKGFSIGCNIVHHSKNSSTITKIVHEEKAVISASIALNKAGTAILVAGFLDNKDANFVTDIYLGEVDKEGELLTKSKYVLPKTFISKTTTLGKSFPDQSDGLSKLYYVRDIVTRDNGTIDIIMSVVDFDKAYFAEKMGTSAGRKIKVGDVLIVSFQNDKVISMLSFNRTMNDSQKGSDPMIVLQEFSIPFVYTFNNNLVILFVTNSANFKTNSSSNDLKDEYLGSAYFGAVKMDETFKVNKQLIYDLSENVKGLDNYMGIVFRKVNKTQYLGYHETEFGMATKAKLAFSVIKFNKL
jgi:hypothetical protein